MITFLLQTALVSAIAASPHFEDGWLAYTGCWRAENAPPASLVCFVPDAAGVRMLEVENGVTRETRIVADGKQRPVSLEGCTGFESSHWSADGARLLLRSELTCGDRTVRKTSGIFAFVSMNQWVSIKAVTVGEQGAANTTRFVPVADAQTPADVAALFPDNRLARETARYGASGRLDFDDVHEALAQVEPRAVEALILAREQSFDLNGKRLLALADAGVPDYVIDAMVAISNPDAFELRPVESIASVATTSGFDDRSLDPYDRYRDRACGRSFGVFSAYDRIDCRYGYDYYGYSRMNSPYTNSPWNYYNTPIIVIRDPSEPESGGGKATRSGYTRGASSGSERARSRDSSPSPAQRPSTSVTSNNGSSSGSSDSGSSSGRTAKPRDN